MDAAKYNRQAALYCPTCGGTAFETAGGPAELIATVKCASCEREISKDDLLAENSENISEHAKEMGKEIRKDAAAEFRKSLKKALRGNKFIKLK